MVICHTGIIASIFCGSLTNHVGKLKFDLPTGLVKESEKSYDADE